MGWIIPQPYIDIGTVRWNQTPILFKTRTSSLSQVLNENHSSIFDIEDGKHDGGKENDRGKVLEMGVLDKIKDTLSETGLTEELSAHLNSIGVPAKTVDVKGPEAIHHSTTLGLGTVPLGCVKVDGKNIECVEMYRFMQSGKSGASFKIGGIGLDKPGNILYKYQYVMRAKVGEREDDLNAKVEYETKGLVKKEIVNFYWKGGRLAQTLNADTELKDLLVRSGVPPLVVHASKKDGYVAISLGQVIGGLMREEKGGYFQMTMGKRDFPSQQAFAMYDKIMGHVRSMS